LKGEFTMNDHSTYSGLAALSICEALLLALKDAQILPESEIMGVLKDAAASHEAASQGVVEHGVDATTENDRAKHKGAATLINQILSSGNSVRRT